MPQEICDSTSYDCFNKAATLKDIKYCDEIKNNDYFKWNCYSSVAVETRNDYYCDLIKNDEQDECHVSVAPCAKDEMICHEINNRDKRNQCFWLVAIAKNDATICSNIDKSDTRYSICYRDIADCKNDYNICGKLSGVSRDKCMIEIVREKREKDISVCERFVTVDQWKISCLHEIETGNYLDPADEQFEEKCPYEQECCIQGLTC